MRARSLRLGQRGITDLETAIVLIAFVVVSSVFAFVALSTGLFSSDKVKEPIQAGLAETRGNLELKGSVILSAVTTGTTANVNDISFQVANAAGGESIDLTPGKTLIKYTDEEQSKMFVTTGPPPGFTITAFGDADASEGVEFSLKDIFEETAKVDEHLKDWADSQDDIRVEELAGERREFLSELEG